MKRSLPIRRRLALIIAVSLGVSLLLTSLFFAARQIDHRRSAKLTELRSMAEVIAFNATAVVEFQDMGAAKRLFAPLGQHQQQTGHHPHQGAQQGRRHRGQHGAPGQGCQAGGHPLDKVMGKGPAVDQDAAPHHEHGDGADQRQQVHQPGRRHQEPPSHRPAQSAGIRFLQQM